jgi:hypothetical protein
LLSISQVIAGMHITLVHLPVLVQCLMVQQVRNFFFVGPVWLPTYASIWKFYLGCKRSNLLLNVHEWCSLFDVSNHLKYLLFSVEILYTITILIYIFLQQLSVRVRNCIYLRSQIIIHMTISKYINLQLDCVVLRFTSIGRPTP